MIMTNNRDPMQPHIDIEDLFRKCRVAGCKPIRLEIGFFQFRDICLTIEQSGIKSPLSDPDIAKRPRQYCGVPLVTTQLEDRIRVIGATPENYELPFEIDRRGTDAGEQDV